MKNCVLCDGKLTKIETLCSNLKILGSHFQAGNYDVNYCNECGLVQCTGNFDSKDFLEYYTSDISTPFSYIKSKGREKTYEYFSHILTEIKPYINESSNILDVGGSWGELAQFLISNGYKNVVTADPNPKCIEDMSSNGLECVKTDASGMYEKMKLKKFDMIILNHILEHIIDIKGTMKSVYELLADNALVFVEVPDVEQ